MIFRPSLTTFIQPNFDPHNRLSGTATEFQQKSHQTGSEVISQQMFQISTPNLVCTWKTLQHVPMCKGNFISSKMIDIKQIALIANAKIMLYTFFIQKVILWFNHKFIWRHLRMFSTQIWKKVDCKMKSRFLVNIWNMHAWLIARVISSVMSPSLLLCSPARMLQLSQTQTFPWHTRKLLETHTHYFMTLWPDQAPIQPLAWSQGPCGSWQYCISNWISHW